MRAIGLVFSVFVALLFSVRPSRAEEIPMLDGDSIEGTVTAVTADGVQIQGMAPNGGTYSMTLDADHVDPQWWYAKRDAALGDDAKARVQLATWAAEHGLFRRAKAQFEKVRKLDPAVARQFQDQVLPKMRAGIAEDLVHSAKMAMDSGKLHAADKMLHAVRARLGDTHAAAEARDLQPTLQHRMNMRLRKIADWKQPGDDEKARQQAADRRAVTDPIVDLLRQGQNIMGHMPPMAAQADAVDDTRQAAVEYKEALSKIEQAEGAHANDKELVDRLHVLRQEAEAGLLQSHVTAGDVYTATGDYDHAAEEATELAGLDGGGADAQALRHQIAEAQSWSDDGIDTTTRWVARDEVWPRR